MRTAIIVAAMAVALTACEVVEPTSSAPTDNPGVAVARLFEVDGCTVYRFEDFGRKVYFTKCPSNADISYSEKCGKHCDRPVIMNTARPRIGL